MMEEISVDPLPVAADVRVRERLSEKLLNDKVMEMLIARPSCSDARSVMLELVEHAADGDNWRIGHFDPGRGDRYTCKLALRRIQEALHGQYDMVGES